MHGFFDLTKREAKNPIPGATMRTFWGEKMLTAIFELEPGTVFPMHDHHYEQTGVVISGEFTFTIGEETKKLGPGDGYLIPGGVVHGGVTGDTKAVIMDVFAPVREEYK